jgi:hypothetical protein
MMACSAAFFAMLSPARIVIVLFCAAAGYLAAMMMRAPASSPHSGTPDHASSTESPPAPAKTVELKVSSSSESPLMAEWEQLKANNGSSVSDFPAIYLAIKDGKDAFRRRAFRSALIAEWAADAPQAALAFLQQKDRAMVGQLMREWLRIEPQGAINALLAGGEKLHGNLRDLLGDIARAAPTRLAEVVSTLPKAESRWDTTTQDAFERFAQKDPELARTAALAVRGPMRAQALSGIAMAWAQSDATAALSWAKELPAGEERDAVLKATLTGWARTDPLAALDHIDLVPPGGDEMAHASDAGAQVLREAGKHDWNMTMRWLREHPGKLGRSSLDGLQSSLSEKLNADPAGTMRAMSQSGVQGLESVFANAILNEGYAQRDAIWRWLDDEASSPFTTAARSSLVNAIAWKEPDVALSFLEKLADSDENKQLLQQGARSLINGGSQISRLDELLEKASPKMRPYLLETAFDFGMQAAGSDPERWIARIAELPQERRSNATASLARGWAGTDPEAAIAWASSLQDSEQRTLAFEAAAQGWATNDPPDAARWINTLPTGLNRDVAVKGLVGALVRNQPENAWTWALSIQTPQLKSDALQLAYMLTRQNDPARAEALLRTGQLSPAEIERLQGRERPVR